MSDVPPSQGALRPADTDLLNPNTTSDATAAWGQETASILRQGRSETKQGSSGSVTSMPASCTSSPVALKTLPDSSEPAEHGGTLLVEDECSRFVPPSHWASAGEPAGAADFVTVHARPLSTTMDEATRDVLMNPGRVAQRSSNGRRSCAVPNRPLPYNTEPSGPSLIYALLGSRFNDEDRDIITQYYPQSVNDCRFLLDVFITNVEAVICLLHEPTLRRAFDAHLAQQQQYEPAARPLGLEGFDKDSHFEPLLFSIFFSAIYSMAASQVHAMFSASKTYMLKRFESALMLALDKESFISSPAIPVLQAFILFLTCRCRDDEMQQIWAPVGLAVRMAQSLGLHQEPTGFSSDAMDAVQVETRRRLWYQIFYLDVRTAVSQGLPPIIANGSFTTRLPSNADDNDIMPGQPPLSDHYDPRKLTAMTIQLVRLHGVMSMQKLLHLVPRDTPASKPDVAPYQTTDDLLAAAEEQDMRLLIETTLEKNQMLYLRYCDSRFPLHRLILNLSNHIKWKFWIHYYYKFPKGQRRSLTPAQKSLIFSQSLNLLESYIHMKKDTGLNPYRWMIDGHSGFHAASYVISVLEDPQSNADLDPGLLERGKHMLQGIHNFSADTESKVGSLLHQKVNNLIARASADSEFAGGSEMNAAFLRDMDISNLDDWVNYLNDTM